MVCSFLHLGFYLRYKADENVVIRKFWKADNPPLETEQADSLLTYLILGVIAGGRLEYVLFYNFGYYYENRTYFARLGQAWHFMVDLQA